MTDQARKHTMGLAGEFLVAGELLRRGVMAAVTYGNAKKADVVAFRGDRATTIEVKTTSEAKWIVGTKLPESSGAIWVLVYLPSDAAQPPQYFVLTSAELREVVLPGHEAYMASYRIKHGKPFSKTGVTSVARSELGDSYRAAWTKVTSAIGES